MSCPVPVAMTAVSSVPARHLTARQRHRCDAAELLHCTTAAHLNDDNLAVTNGAQSVKKSFFKYPKIFVTDIKTQIFRRTNF